MKIGFIGSGNMGGALPAAFVKSGVVDGKDVYLYDVLPAASAALANDIGGTAVKTPGELTAAAGLFVLAVKPVYVKDALRACYAGLAGKAVVSIVAGLFRRGRWQSSSLRVRAACRPCPTRRQWSTKA